MADEEIAEEWRDVEGWPYEVSSLGRVRRTTDAFIINPQTGLRQVSYPVGHLLKGFIGPNGYRMVRLYKGKKGTDETLLVSAIVCKTFHGPRPSIKHQAAHDDGDRLNNRALNLSWKTSKENESDKILHGTAPRGEKNPSAKMRPEQVSEIRRIAGGMTQQEIADIFGISQSSVWRIIRHKTWTHM